MYDPTLELAGRLAAAELTRPGETYLRIIRRIAQGEPAGPKDAEYLAAAMNALGKKSRDCDADVATIREVDALEKELKAAKEVLASHTPESEIRGLIEAENAVLAERVRNLLATKRRLEQKLIDREPAELAVRNCQFRVNDAKKKNQDLFK